jgi:hypothetical protein
MRRALIIAMLLLLAAGGMAFAFRTVIKDAVASRLKPTLPKAEPYHPVPVEPAVVSATTTPIAPAIKPAEVPAKPVTTTKPPVTPLETPPLSPPVTPLSKKEANLALPFTSQAPHANWSLPYQEACEEASLIMVNAFYEDTGALTPEEADKQILALVAWEKKTFGFYEDTTADEAARIADEYYGYKHSRVEVIQSIEDIKKVIDRGVPVILPAAGRLLRNPNFSGQGPLYHMLAVKGYTKDGKVIVNDPGTRRGADYLYDPAVLWNAIHDWNGGDVEHGRKVMLVVEK